MPDDVAVVGYDDVELAAMTDPPLTTVHQPTYELGATAYELLRSGSEPEQRLFSPHLVERESTGAPRASARRSRRGAAVRGRPRPARSSMSEVADGPETSTIGRPSVAARFEAA